MSAARTALVVGGGIGGLSAALALAERGLRVTVVEQAREFGEAGAGIQLSPNATRLLIAAGIEKPLRELGFVPKAVEMRTWKRGFPVTRAPLGPDLERRFGAPYLSLHRADLIRVLADAVAGTAAIEVVLGARCESIESDARGVRAVLSSGTSLEADVLVGADGIKSVVRAQLHGPEAPRFTGCVAWRGVVPAEAVARADVRPVASIWLGPRAHFVHYYLRAGQLVNFVAIFEKTGWEIESWTEPGDKAELQRDFGAWHPTVRALIDAVDPAALFKWALFDRDPLARWSRGRATLLGDACHATLPFMAQGACMAIEDGAVLAACLAADDDPEAALGRYEALRRERTARIQLGSRANARLYHLAGRDALRRNLAMRLRQAGFAQRSEALFAYDARAAASA